MLNLLFHVYYFHVLCMEQCLCLCRNCNEISPQLFVCLQEMDKPKAFISDIY